MSLRKQHKEIQRLIDAFASEADRFHDISLSTFFVTLGGSSTDRSFRFPNHSIMLWQYYGVMQSDQDIERLMANLQESDLKWGLQGAELSSFAVIEGPATSLFLRMAKRAGNLFNQKELQTIRSLVLDDITAAELDKHPGKKPTATTNSNPLAVWLNYLLYHLSMTHPGREKDHRIEPDPFTLSLLALERLAQDSTFGKIDRSSSPLQNIQFKVAVSFPGELRTFVSGVVTNLCSVLGTDTVFYDHDYQAQLARPNLDILLQQIYRDNSDLVVVFLCAEYAKKQWCGLEWRAIRDLIKSMADNKVMFVRFDNAKIDGIFSIDGYIDGRIYSEPEVAKFILQRLNNL